MTTKTERSILNLLNQPLYTFAEADHLAHVRRGTARRWLAGYRYMKPGAALVTGPPVGAGQPPEGGVSFLDLVEVVAIGRLREFGFTLQEIRRIVENCQRMLKRTRPLVSLEFKVGGREIFVGGEIHLIEVGKRRGMQAWNEVLHPFLESLDYADELARRWWPLGKDKPVVIDPEYAFGLPVVRDTGVRTEVILERFQSGDLEEQIAADFNISGTEVQRALQFELSRAA